MFKACRDSAASDKGTAVWAAVVRQHLEPAVGGSGGLLCRCVDGIYMLAGATDAGCADMLRAILRRGQYVFREGTEALSMKADESERRAAVNNNRAVENIANDAVPAKAALTEPAS